MNATARGGRSMPDIVSEAFTICVRHWRAVYAATAVPAVLLGLVTFGISSALNSAGVTSGNTAHLSAAAEGAVLAAGSGSILSSLVLYLAAHILVYPVVVAAILKRHPSARPLPGTFGAIASGVAVSVILVVVAALLSVTLIGIPIAIVLGVRWSFAGEELARGAKGPVAALRASWHTVRGAWLRVAITSLAIGMLGILPRLALAPISAAFNRAAVDIVVYVAGSLLTLPFVTVATVVLYVDVLTRKGEQLQPAPASASLEEER